MKLEGKIALVTGGARRVGKAIALALAGEGANIILHYGRSENAAQDTARAIKSRGVDAHPIQADLRHAENIAALFQTVQEQYGHLDVLVNSAASFVKEPFDAITPDSWAGTLHTNLRAPFLCTQHAACLMRAVERTSPAAIVNITDLSGIQAWQGYTQHGVSKAGLIHLTQLSAAELGPDVRVNAIAPGAILPPPGVSEQDAHWQRFAEYVPLRRTGDPSFVAETVLFLIHNDYITGVLIPVDGGEHLIGPALHGVL
jgi:NAD(P)-dependent dehydrogenase (short-subunit alcohol dehydrogenase family)